MNKKRTGEFTFVYLRALIPILLCVAAVGTLPGFSRPEAPTNTCYRTLTFAERVAYQRAIEDVYWQHRIWPRENPKPKPSLAEVMSQRQIEQKVEEYMQNSQLLADRWQRLITPKQLQAELNRLASHTKQPEVLRELFEALGNDPFLIAECLARPVLTKCLIVDLSLRGKGQHFASLQTEAADSNVNIVSLGTASYVLPEIDTCSDNTWTATNTTGVPGQRAYHTAVWTGSEMIVWGGLDIHGLLNTGGRYNPSTDSWVAMTTAGAPDRREAHTAVWTGTEMIIWGGGSNSTFLDTGGRYNPSTDSWIATTVAGAPEPRRGQTAVWTGTEMIVWGGFSDLGNANDGGRYNPNTDSWIATATDNVPDARAGHTAVWTGSEMIVWGGSNGTNLNTGGRYNPNTDSWIATSTTNAPDGRALHTAVWTGNEMTVWGGYQCCSTYVNTGGRYNPSTDSWVGTNVTEAPAARDYHTAVWTGSEIIVWGGTNDGGINGLNTGGRYDPSTDSWIATTTIAVPLARFAHTAVWTGSEMIVWGGNGVHFENTGGRYCAQSGGQSPTPTPTPTGTATATATVTATPAATSTPSPRLRPMPRPRPTPAPRP